MGNEQSAEAAPAPQLAQPGALPTAERSALRRLESTHLSEEPATLPLDPPLGPPPGQPSSQARGTTTTIVNTRGTTAPEPGKPKPPPPNNNKVVHVADAAEGDRRKFYHASVETTTVGDDENDEDDTAAGDAGKEDKFAAFVRWMKEHGARFPDQHLVKYTEECRGVHAKKDIPADEQIAYIPLKLLIHEGHGQETDVGAKVWNSPNNNVIVPAHTQVIIFMMLSGAREAACGKECTSFFAPYFRILPENFDCFPIFWTEEELSWLAGSDLVRQIRDRRRNIIADYHEVSRICPSFGERFTEDDFLWCRTAVGSRNFGININGIKRTTMVPWADMLNHFRPRETSWTFSNDQQGFTMTSLKPLAAGQQIMDSYGKKCNSKFLMHYGFAIEKNREEDGKCMNEMPLVLALEKFDDEDKESAMLHSRRLQHVSARITLRVKMHCDDDATAEALSFCRVAVANSEELDEIDTRGYHGDSFVSPVSARNEIAALFMLANVCRTRLEKYPTSLNHVLGRLADDATLEPFSNHRNALIVIKSELEILHFFISLSELATPIFSMPIDVAIRHVQDNFSGADMRYDDWARYLRSVVYDLQSLNSGYASY